MNSERTLKPLALVFVCSYLFAHTTTGQTPIENQIKAVIDDWYTSVSHGDFEHFRDLLTDDFQLLAFGSRFDKTQILEMSKDYANITYTLANVRVEGDETMAHITFDVELKCNYKGQPIVGNAMEVYLLEKAKGRWKVNTKVIVMIEPRK